MNEKVRCEVCNIDINGGFIDKHNKTKSHNNILENDILILTIKNGTHKTKEEWFNDFKTIGITIPQFVIDYDFDKPKISPQKKYYEKNKKLKNKKAKTKEEILLHNKERYICICGKEIANHSKAKHEKSNYHIKRVKNQ